MSTTSHPDREQYQRIKFAMVLSLDVHVVHRHQDGHRRPRQEQVPEINGEPIDHHRVHERGHHLAMRLAERYLNFDQPGRGKQHTHKSSCCIRPFPVVRQHQVDKQDPKRKDGQQNHG